MVLIYAQVILSCRHPAIWVKHGNQFIKSNS
jgi:hypothetical protein